MPSESSVTNLERTRGILRHEKHLWGQRGEAEISPVQNGGLDMLCGTGGTAGTEADEYEGASDHAGLACQAWASRQAPVHEGERGNVSE